MQTRGNIPNQIAERPSDDLVAILSRPDVRVLIANVVAGRLSLTAVPTEWQSIVGAVAEAIKAIAFRKLLKEDEAATRLNVSVKTLQNHRSLNRGIKAIRPFGKNSRAVRYDPLYIAAAMLPDE